jgi:polysaccharide biosynthesis transport protein
MAVQVRQISPINMLQSHKADSSEIAEEPIQPTKSLVNVIDSYLGFVRRQYPIILSCLLLAATAGAFYLLITPARYTASATMIIDPRQTQVSQQRSPLGDPPLDSAIVNATWFESQFGILKSTAGSVASTVVKNLGLAHDPEFIDSNQGLITALVGSVFATEAKTGKPKSEPELIQQATNALVDRFQLSRVGGSYLIKIDFLSLSPEKATKIVNALADAYIQAELNGRLQDMRRATDWLQDRLQTLHEQGSTAEQAVVTFKATHNIVAVGGAGAGTLSDQKLTELNGQASAARAHTAEVQARLNRIESIVQSGSPDAVDATISDALSNAIITRLRSQYLDLASREADWSARLGSNHLAVVNVRNQMREIRNSMLDELRRIGETYKSEYAIAQKRQQEAEQQLAVAVAQSQGTNEAQITLRGLESTAQSYHALYDNFLQHYTETVQQMSAPISETRVISSAPGAFKSQPKTLMVIGVTIAGGIILGIGLGTLRETLDRGFRTREQVETALQIECVALLPVVKNGELSIPARNQRAISDGRGLRIISQGPSTFRAVIDSPFSQFAEAIRAIKLAADCSSIKVIGLTSSLPAEGKSTISTALAALLAQAGNRTILVDCDFRNPSLSRRLAPNAVAGTLEVITRKKTIEEVTWSDPDTNMAFLPIVANHQLANTSQILGGDAIKSLFIELRRRYEYIVVDLSPLAPVVDVRATTQLVDAYFLLIEWGRTGVDVVQHALKDARGVHENILGAVLNKVDMDSIGRYEGSRAKYYRNKSFARYGYTYTD